MQDLKYYKFWNEFSCRTVPRGTLAGKKTSVTNELRKPLKQLVNILTNEVMGTTCRVSHKNQFIFHLRRTGVVWNIIGWLKQAIAFPVLWPSSIDTKDDALFACVLCLSFFQTQKRKHLSYVHRCLSLPWVNPIEFVVRVANHPTETFNKMPR